MKILAIGDFHGRFPSKLLKRIRKEAFDVIVSPGDFCYDKELNRLFFKYAYGTNIELWEFIGRKKNNGLERKNLLAGFRILEILNSLGKPVIAITGNWDPVNYEEVGLPKVRDPNSKRFMQYVKRMKNIKIIDFKKVQFSGTSFVGYPRSTYPGKSTAHILKRFRDRFKGKSEEVFDKISSDNEKYFNIFKGLVDDKTIFVSHNCPYRSKLDKIKKGSQSGRHYGSFLLKEIISELAPKLVVCGHMHENQGMQKIGTTLVVNTGPAFEGKAAIIDVNDKTNVKFIR